MQPAVAGGAVAGLEVRQPVGVAYDVEVSAPAAALTAAMIGV